MDAAAAVLSDGRMLVAGGLVDSDTDEIFASVEVPAAGGSG